MGMFDQENAGLSDPVAQKEAQRIVSYRDQTDTQGYVKPPDQPPNELQGAPGQGFGAMANPGYFSMPNLAPSTPAAPNNYGPGMRGAFPDPVDNPQAGPVTRLAYNPPPDNANGVFSNPFSTYTAGQSGGEGGGGLAARGYPVTIDTSATQPRPGPIAGAVQGYADQVDRRVAQQGASNAYGGGQTSRSTGAVEAGAEAGPQGLGGTMAPYTPPPGTPTVQDYRNQLAAQELRDGFRQANDARALQERNYTQINQANAADATQTAERAEGAARVANWRASNGADMVLAAGNPAYAKQRKVIADQANVATTRADQLGAAATAANAAVGKPLGNPIDDFAKAQEGLQHGQQGNIAGQQAPLDAQLKQQQLATGQQHIDLGQFDVASRKRIDEIGNKLATETDPTKISNLHSTLLALLGKDKPEEYQVIHAPGQQHVDPRTLATVKDADHVIIVNKRTSQAQVLKMGDEGGAAARTPPAEAVAMLKAKDSPAMRAMFEKNYGLAAGGAAQFLQ